MIVQEKQEIFKLLFTLQGSIVPLVLPQIVVFTLLGLAVALGHHYYPGFISGYTSAPLALIGITLSIFMGFRNNACYERWWEARKQWGQLVSDTRSLAYQLISFIDDNPENDSEDKESNHKIKSRLVYLFIAFTYALKNKLRGEADLHEIKKYIQPNDLSFVEKSDKKDLSNHFLYLIGKELKLCQENNLLTDMMLQSINDRVMSIIDILGSCERIKNTPIPFAYRLLVIRTAYLYCLILPFGLVSSLGFSTPVVSAIVAYAFFGIDILSEELSEPFGFSYNGMPLSSLSRTIEINLLDLLGETTLPSHLKAKNGYLS